MSSKNLIDLRNAGKKRAEPAPSRDPLVQQSLKLRPDRPASPRAISRRISPVRIRRQRTRFIIVGLIFAAIAAAVYGVGWVSYLPRYNVGDVKVVGTQNVPQKLVYDYVESQLYTGVYAFLSKDNIFLYNPHALEREIVGFFPRIQSATVSRDSILANAITVTIQERQPFALWCDAPQSGSAVSISDCYEMDATGFIFAQASPADPSVQSTLSSLAHVQSALGEPGSGAASSSAQAEGSVNSSQPQASQYVFEGGLSTTSAATSSMALAPSEHPIGHVFVGAHMHGIIALLQMLGQAGFSPVGAFVENDQDFRIPLTQGFYLKASFGENPATIVNNLQLVLSSDALSGKLDEIEYIDLRFGDRVYYKLRGQAQAQTPGSSQ